MKTSTQLAQAQTRTLWYAERPFAYRCRDDYQKRMMIGLLVVFAILSLAMVSYFLSVAFSEPVTVREREKIQVGIIDPPPPPPAVEDNKPTPTATGSSGSSDLLTVNTSTATGRQAVQQIVEQTLSNALQEMAGNAGLLREGQQGPPVAIEGAQGGLLDATSGGSLRMSGLTGLTQSGLTTNQGASLSYEQGAQTLNGNLSKNNLGGSEGNRVSIAKRGTLTLRETDRRLQIQSGGRGKEEILAVVRSYQPAIYGAYKEARQAAGGSLKGSAVLRIIIAPDGAVRSAEVIQCSINDENFKRLLASKARKMQFSKIASAAMQQVDIPYEFGEEN